MSSLKARLQGNQPVVGTFSFSASPAVIEVLGHCGFDYVIIDMEHASPGWETVEHLIRAAATTGLSALVRLPAIAQEHILKALDCGAEGVVLPFVRTAADIRRAVEAAYYHPLGKRGYCSQARAGAYGTLLGGYGAHTLKLNERVVIVALVEDVSGIDNLPEILALDPGVDAILLGRGDLAVSLGLAGQPDAPEVRRVVDRVFAHAAKAARPRPIGVVTYDVFDGASLKPWHDKGVRMFTAVSDVAMLAQAGRSYLGHFAERQKV